MRPLKKIPLQHLLLVIPLWCCTLPIAARADSAFVRSKSKGPVENLHLFFPAPTQISGNRFMLVVPLLGPGGVLLPRGKLLVWVGRNDGTPLPNATVTINVPTPGNQLDQGGVRAGTMTIHTDANGIAEVFLAAPDGPDEPISGPGGYG